MGISRQEEDMEHEDRIAASYKKTRREEWTGEYMGWVEARGKRCEEHGDRIVTGNK